jgi:Flp pilus assembly protein TadG
MRCRGNVNPERHNRAPAANRSLTFAAQSCMRGRALRTRRGAHQRGVTAVQMAVLFVPVFCGMIGFAVDLGVLYAVRGELRQGAIAMALAAAQQLNGTDASAGRASEAMLQTIENSSGFGNRYYFQGLPIGDSSATSTSTVADPGFFSSVAEAIANGSGAVGGPEARHVRIALTGQTQLLFWSFLPVVSDRNLTITASAAPLCTACGIEPMAIGAIDPADTTNFGYILGTKYSFYFFCTGAAPALLAGTAQSAPYLLLNRYNAEAAAFIGDTTQAYRQGAAGLPGSPTTALACFRYNDVETIWPTTVISACNANQAVPQAVNAALCGVYSRFDNQPPAACTGIPEIETIAGAYQPDTDAEDHDAYLDYTGNSRRIITVPVVDTLSATAAMTVQGFRQFLVMPEQGSTITNPADAFGRLVAMYMGSVAPVKQGRFDGCSLSSGPGKVVLHQ